jgi:transcriptional regulator of arginine metabolism
MPVTRPKPVEPDLRRRLIRELVRKERIHSQDELRRRLRQEGIRAEQATLSRDLHALGVLKGGDGYALPDSAASPTSARAELAALVRQYLVEVSAAGHLVVLRTGPGRAQPLALALDTARISGVLGTIAGDDTIFVAVADAPMAHRLERLLGLMRDGGTLAEDAFEPAPRVTRTARP